MAGQQGGFGSSQGTSQFTRDDAFSPSLLRVKKDIADFFADPPPGIFIAPEEKDITLINALMVGSPNTPYEGGFFRLRLTCPANYPMSPPGATFLTTDAGRVSFNVFIHATGYICLDILNSHGMQSWSPAQSLSSLLISIQSLLNDNPYEKLHQNQQASNHHKIFLLHETIRVAVCDAVEDCLQDDSSFPPAFRGVVMKKFEEFYTKYEDAVKTYLQLSGTVMGAFKGVYQFETLLSRLRNLKERVAKKNEEAAAAAAAAAAAVTSSSL